MPDWPRFTDPALVERLGLDHEAFVAHLAGFLDQVPKRALDRAAFEKGLAYPWARPATSSRVDDGHVTPLDALAPDERDALVDRDGTGDRAGTRRFPLVAIGAIGAPAALSQRLAFLEAPEDRRALVLTGALHDHDVVAAAAPTAYGSMPATLEPSPGTAVRAAVLWLSEPQLQQLAWAELPYWPGRLAGACFTPDEPIADVADPLAFVSRWGAFVPDGEPLALAAIPAEGRRFAARTQEQLLAAAALRALGPEAGAWDLVERLFADMGRAVRELVPLVRAQSRPFAGTSWTPHPAAAQTSSGANASTMRGMS